MKRDRGNRSPITILRPELPLPPPPLLPARATRVGIIARGSHVIIVRSGDSLRTERPDEGAPENSERRKAKAAQITGIAIRREATARAGLQIPDDNRLCTRGARGPCGSV